MHLRIYIKIIYCFMLVTPSFAFTQEATNYEEFSKKWNSHIGVWNDASGVVINAYLDPVIPPDEWVSIARAELVVLRKTALDFRGVALEYRGTDIGEVAKVVASNYFEKASALTELHIAVAMRDEDAEMRAMSRLRSAAEAANRYVEAMSKRLSIIESKPN